MTTAHPLPPEHNRDALGGRGKPRHAIVVADLAGKPLEWWFGAPWRKALRAAQNYPSAAVWTIRSKGRGRYCRELVTVWETLS